MAQLTLDVCVTLADQVAEYVNRIPALSFDQARADSMAILMSGDCRPSRDALREKLKRQIEAVAPATVKIIPVKGMVEVRVTPIDKWPAPSAFIVAFVAHPVHSWLDDQVEPDLAALPALAVGR